MALTLAVGLVVDDAIVMLENIFRYLEQGDDRLTAALKGAGEIGFTIVSITVSLIAVFIPILFMGGIIGRLFRDRKSTRLNSSHSQISYAVFCLKKKTQRCTTRAGTTTYCRVPRCSGRSSRVAPVASTARSLCTGT